MTLPSILESLIFASDKPLSAQALRELTQATAEQLRPALAEVRQRFSETGIQLVEIAGGYQFRTNPEFASWTTKLRQGRPMRLSRAMLEVLAIVAYRQPITRPELEDIRGVDCSGPLRVLLERKLVQIVGKKEEPGRPILYGTTKFFLQFFGLKGLRDLPTLKEFSDLTEEHAKQVEMQFGGKEDPLIGEEDPAVLEGDGKRGTQGEPDTPTHASPSNVGSDSPETALQENTEGALSPEAPTNMQQDAPPPSEADGAPSKLPPPKSASTGDDQADDAALAGLDAALERAERVLAEQQQ